MLCGTTGNQLVQINVLELVVAITLDGKDITSGVDEPLLACIDDLTDIVGVDDRVDETLVLWERHLDECWAWLTGGGVVFKGGRGGRGSHEFVDGFV